VFNTHRLGYVHFAGGVGETGSTWRVQNVARMPVVLVYTLGLQVLTTSIACWHKYIVIFMKKYASDMRFLYNDSNR